MKNHRGLTLLEVVFVMALLALIVGTAMFLYVTILKGWDQYGRRTDVRGKIQFALENMVRDARKANAINIPAQTNALCYTVCEGSPCANTSYLYYLYNASNSWTPAPVSYNQTAYQLRKINLSNCASVTINALTYGTGDLITSELNNATTITSSGNVAQINLIGTSLNGNLHEDIQVRGYVRPRNA